MRFKYNVCLITNLELNIKSRLSVFTIENKQKTTTTHKTTKTVPKTKQQTTLTPTPENLRVARPVKTCCRDNLSPFF